MIIAIGASLKGMGASGLTIETEEARLRGSSTTASRTRSSSSPSTSAERR